MADLTAALLLTDSFQTVTTKGVRLEFMGLNNTHTAEVVVTIADGRGYPLHSEAIGYATGGGGKLADLRFPMVYFASGLQIKASVTNVVYAWPVYRDA